MLKIFGFDQQGDGSWVVSAPRLAARLTWFILILTIFSLLYWKNIVKVL